MEWKPKFLGEEYKIKALQENIGVPFEIANLLVQRGIQDFEAAKNFFRPELSDLHDPYLMLGMEAQFFDDEIVKVCNDLANRGVRVIVAGLDMDFKGNPFGPMPALMATAEYITKLHAICTHTGNLAHYSYRKSEQKDLVVLGEKKDYKPLSRSAFYKMNKKKR